MGRIMWAGLVVVVAAMAFLAAGPASVSARPRKAIAARWTQEQELTSSNGVPDGDFGNAAVSGKTIVVGASQHAYGDNKDQGLAYIFTHTSSGWSQKQILTASDGTKFDGFGAAVAIAGSTVLIGAPLHKVGSNTEQGAVYVFAYDHGQWRQTGEITAPDGAVGDHFGASVAMDGRHAVVGALFHGQGAAYFLNDNRGKWNEAQEVTDPAVVGNLTNQFGTSVAISGAEAIISAPDATVGSNAQQGVAFLYVHRRNVWAETQEITAVQGVSALEFGASAGFSPAVAIGGKTAVVGAFYMNNFQGTAYVFTKSRKGWVQTEQLTPSGLSSVAAFGTVVALQGKRMAIGAQWNGSDDEGSVYTYVRSGRGWAQQQEITASNAADGDMLGSSVGMAGATLVIGAFHVESQTGAAYVFTAGR
jgi:hypothetical protein